MSIYKEADDVIEAYRAAVTKLSRRRAKEQNGCLSQEFEGKP